MTKDGATVQLDAVSVAAQDPLRLARFWAAALRWDLGPTSADGEVALVPTDGTRFLVRFRPGAGPKEGPDRYHLDLTTASIEDQQDTVAQLLALGGRHLDVGQGPDEDHVVLADPEGNELCVIGPENRFLADCPRLGCVNGDGTQAVGRFWSRALGWPLVWDQDEETAVRAPDLAGPLITWGGPPVTPKVEPNRLRLELAPGGGIDRDDALAHLVACGARLVADEPDGHGTTLLDPDDNELRLLP